MDTPPPIEVERLREDSLDDVVRIHLAGLGYTLNSKLGPDHLRFLYSKMASNPLCYVAVGVVDGVTTGVISGTTDADRLKSSLVRSMSARQIIGLLSALVMHPALMWQWLKETRIGAPLRYGGKPIRAMLTTLAVDPRSRKRGTGRHLVSALEAHFLSQAIPIYHLETLVENETARAFYRNLGFVEAGRRAGSYVLVKEMQVQRS